MIHISVSVLHPPDGCKTDGSDGNSCIRIPGVNVVFLQLRWFGVPAAQYRPPLRVAFGVFELSAIVALFE